MPNSLIRYTFLSITLSAFAAGCTANLTEVLEDYKKESNLTFTDCGQAGSVRCDPVNPSPTMGMVQACLIEAFGSCKPAQARINSGTTEGDPITDVYFVAPDGKGGCKIEHFYDTTRDNFGPQRVIQSECATVSNGVCRELKVDGCTQVKEY